MKRIRYPAEFRAEAVKQVTERGHGVVDVAKRLGMSGVELAPIPRTVQRFLTSWVFSIKLTWGSQSIQSTVCAGTALFTGTADFCVLASSLFCTFSLSKLIGEI